MLNAHRVANPSRNWWVGDARLTLEVNIEHNLIYILSKLDPY